ncbi:MAG: cell wall hydrolase [Oscillospiraceae bacterium]|nr:cell wall hydrolase [Oscillospiraceae bacterium]
MKRLITALLMLALLAVPTHAYEGDRVTTARQDALHEAADILRSCGYAEDSDVIKTIQAEWRAEQEKLDIIAKVIDHEAPPEWCEWEHSVAVGVVVLNRVASPLFPDSVREVVAAPGQYLRSYTYGFDGTSRIAYEAAAAALDGAHDVPEDCYWQDTNVQGKAIWRAFTVDTGYFRSTTYICRGVGM